jgi:hypothetical protein
MIDHRREPTTPEDRLLADELLARTEADRRARHWAEHSMSADGVVRNPEIRRRINEVDRRNTTWMRGVLDRYGWPGRRLVGDAGSEAAWLLCQHADRELGLQRQALRLLKRAVTCGEASPRHLAYQTDRVLVAEGRAQRYGTQFHSVAGKLAPRPIEEPESLDHRRAEMGLEPFAEYARNFGTVADSRPDRTRVDNLD